MPRLPNEYSSEFPYHITARSMNRERFAIPIEDVWRIMEDFLFFIHHSFEVRIHSFVLMPNHFHLILRTPKNNLAASMNYFMRETSRQIGFQASRINQNYGGRFHRSLMKRPLYFLHAYKYVYRNPVEAQLSKNVEEYEFSTLRGLLGYKKLSIPLELDSTLFTSAEQTLDWLNQKPALHSKLQLKRALSKGVFQLSRDPNSGILSPFEEELY